MKATKVAMQRSPIAIHLREQDLQVMSHTAIVDKLPTTEAVNPNAIPSVRQTSS